MIYTVDRLEEGVAVLEEENGEMKNIPLAALPPEIREGDKLEQTESGFRLRPDLCQQAQERRQRLRRRLHRQEEEKE